MRDLDWHERSSSLALNGNAPIILVGCANRIAVAACSGHSVTPHEIAPSIGALPRIRELDDNSALPLAETLLTLTVTGSAKKAMRFWRSHPNIDKRLLALAQFIAERWQSSPDDDTALLAITSANLVQELASAWQLTEGRGDAAASVLLEALLNLNSTRSEGSHAI